MLDILAAAAEHGEPAEATAWGLNAGGWVAVAMIVVLVLAVLAGAPRAVAKMLDSRIEGIRKQLDEAKSLRAEAEKLRDEYARKAASALEDAANRLSAKNPDELIDDTREFVRKSPGVALAGAAIIGFALVRLVKAGLDQGKNDKS